MVMKPPEISPVTQRRFIIGLQGLYPGRRWKGKAGIVPAIRALGGLQVDPLNVIARSHDIALWGRVQGYRMTDLDTLLYRERQLFDWGGLVMIYPMDELPHWRLVMARRRESPRYLKFIEAHGHVLEDVLSQVRERGPMSSADFSGNTVRQGNFRSGKDTGQALYHLWLTGELMTHSRRGFQRVYDLLERVAPAEMQHISSVEDAEQFFSRKVWAWCGMVTTRGWRSVFQGIVERPVNAAEAQERLDTMERAGEIAAVQITGRKDPYYVRTEDLPLLIALHQETFPAEWQPLESTTADEVVFLAPLDIVSARGRAKVLFDFEYLWEVYKPAEKRRWGYYTLPVLYQDTLVARIDPKLERATATLQLKGLWLEPGMDTGDHAFSRAMARGMWNFMQFVGARQIDLSAIQPDPLRAWVDRIFGTL